MTNPAGSYIWYELMTPDIEGARAFYQPLIGWTIDEEAGGDMDYRMISTADGPVGGALQLNADMMEAGARPLWIGYINVDDVDATADAMIADGATCYMRHEVPDIGRFAMIGDPHGGSFYIMKPVPPADRPDADSIVFAPGTLGHCGWNELWSRDHKAALSFYHRHFGWDAPEAMDMAPGGEYRFIDHHGLRLGAAMSVTGDSFPPAWNHYWNVASIEAARAQVEASGGTVLMGPHEVPTGQWILIGRDPQGAMFHLVGGK